MIILVNGLMEYNAGKTSVVRAILHRALDRGEEFLAFKPRSAHNYWEHFDHSRTCESLGTLVSRDALLFQDMFRKPPPVELVNPYHQLMCPIDLMRAQEVGEHLLTGSQDLILAERLTHPGKGTTLFLNRKPDIFVAPAGFLAALKRGTNRVRTFRTSPVAEGKAQVEECVRDAFEVLARDHENLIIESFSDVTLPLELDEKEIDLMVSVGGSLVLFFDPEQVMKAVEVVGGKTTKRLLRYLKPISTFRVPHLSSEERADAEVLSRAYDRVLQALWDRP